MPTRQEQLKRRRRAQKRRRQLRTLLLWVVVIAAVVAVVALIKTRDKTQLLSPEDTAPTTLATGNSTTPTDSNTSTTTMTPTTTTAPKTYKDGHYVQTAVPSWELRLVNPWNPLPTDYDYTANLQSYIGEQQFDSRAMNALRQMIAAGSAYNLSAASLYRSYDLQTSLFNRQVNRVQAQGYTGAEAEAKAATVVARPGTSEHHMGLAADILGSGYGSLEESFENTPAFAWLKEHCAEYGFILRYPKEKQEITGVIYEPWHYRYVGVEAATEIMSRGITLEEYLEEKGM